jgi:CubicO group peptidase (beta-lactamase class C family)
MSEPKRLVLFDRARAVLEEARLDGAFPAAVCEVGSSEGPFWAEAFGRLSYETDATAATTGTAFDLASLTKVIVTTSVAMALVRRQVLAVATRVADVVPGWRGADRAGITVGQLLDHSSGLPAQFQLPPSARVRTEALASLCSVPLERPPGSAAVYSDVGFMLLGLLLEIAAGRPLDVLWRELWDARPGAGPTSAWLGFRPDASKRPFIAPTELVVERGGMLQGVVHDENAAVLSGVAGHAGLFGSAPATGVFAAWVLRSFRDSTWLATPELMRQFSSRGAVPGSSRALGWDTMLPTSSCGSRMSPTAIGHTGFTGTSLWIDWERDVYVVLLTNRVHPSRQNERFLPYRARVHDAVMADLSGSTT